MVSHVGYELHNAMVFELSTGEHCLALVADGLAPVKEDVAEQSSGRLVIKEADFVVLGTGHVAVRFAATCEPADAVLNHEIVSREPMPIVTVCVRGRLIHSQLQRERKQILTKHGRLVGWFGVDDGPRGVV